ncbi:MAG: ECF transporter S component [Oscillospiraceae bacterium]
MKPRFSTRQLAVIGMMTALVFASNYAQIIMPIPIGGTPRFTLANIMCVLSGLILGPVGGVASGLGSALYDLTFPAYAPECWITFINKGVMGLVTGLVAFAGLRRKKEDGDPAPSAHPYLRYLVAALAGCAAYYVLYFAKSIFYNGMLIEGLTFITALAILPLKAWTSVFNAAVAVVVAPPLTLSIRAALKKAGIKAL